MKAATVAELRKRCRDLEATRVGMVIEAWMVIAEPGEEIDEFIRPFDNPKRKEGLWIAVQAKGAPEIAGYYEIKREGGKAAVGKFKRFSSAGVSIGIFDNLVGEAVLQ